MGTLEQKWGPNGDPKTEKGPHGNRVPQMGTHVGAVQCLRVFQRDFPNMIKDRMKSSKSEPPYVGTLMNRQGVTDQL